MRALIALLLCGMMAQAQVTTARLSGMVTDPQGAAIPGAAVTVVDERTSAKFEATTSERGEWNVPALKTSTYRVTVSAKGFKTAVIPGVVLEPNVPGTVNAKLEIGAVAEVVEVTGGAEVLQTESATVSSTMTGRQINELPFPSRNALDLLINEAGTSTPGTQRTTSINGLGQGTMNITLDGINIQDNLLKSSDGFLAWMMPRVDAVEEVSIQSAAVGAESSSEGAAQIKFVTKSGTNQFHGGVFWQHRNDFFNSNYYFNNRNGLPRDRVLLNQFGGRLGGPILKNRLFFFVSEEELRLPQTANDGATLLTPDATNGIFRYRDSTGVLRSINLYALAGAAKFPSTPDPIVGNILQQMQQLSSAGRGSIQARTLDLNRNDYYFQIPDRNTRHYPGIKLDAIINSKNQVSFTYHYQSYKAVPDVVNGSTPVLPGTGAVLGSDAVGTTRRIVFSPVASLRSVVTPRLTSELRFGLLAGSTLFRDDISPGLFQAMKGYALSFNGYIQNPENEQSQSRRNPPVWQGNEGLTWIHSNHVLNFGGSFTQVSIFQRNIGLAIIPQATFAIAANDPVNTGATSLFTTTNFPNSTPTNRSDAAQLYAILTGRVSSISRSVNLDDKTRQYGANPSTDRVRQRQFGLYMQDSWKLRPHLTLNYGLRWDVQTPYVNTNGNYTRVGIQGVYGLSGVGNLFNPGVMTGTVPQYLQTGPDTTAYNTYWKNFEPSLGFAWQSKGGDHGPLNWLLGRHGVVVRGGYSIASVREGMDTFITNGWGSNQGRTLSTSVSPGSNPAEFGPPGGVLFSDPTLPSRSVSATPSYPIPVVAGNGVYDFDPNLRPGYVQSWNLSVQREITKNTVVDVRYVGNHGAALWRKLSVNEVNIYENGFLNEFKIAQNNLAIARVQSPASINFGNQGLPGQHDIPIISTALGLTSDTTFATYIAQAQAGRVADGIAFNSARMTRLLAAHYPANFFVANPTVLGGDAMLVINSGNSTYNALQVEVRRRLSTGLQVQGSYAFAKSLTDLFSSRSGTRNQPDTLRNVGLDKGPSPWDIRNQLKVNWIYELPFGPRRHFFTGGNHAVLRKALEGWQIAGVTRIQSGTPELLRSGRQVVNSAGNQGLEADGGVVLHNMTAQQLNGMLNIRKTGGGLIYYLPQDLINNTLAAYELGGKILDPTQPYIGPPTSAGEFGYRIFLYGPWQEHFDASVMKKTRIAEKKELEVRAQCINVFNVTNFLFSGAGNVINDPTIGTGLGQTTSAYRDFTIAGTSNPGGRVLEFSIRINF